jgi:hypothetical protein
MGGKGIGKAKCAKRSRQILIMGKKRPIDGKFRLDHFRSGKRTAISTQKEERCSPESSKLVDLSRIETPRTMPEPIIAYRGHGQYGQWLLATLISPPIFVITLRRTTYTTR